MQYRPLGRSGVRVSALCLGTMMFGDRTSEAESNEIVAAGRDAGINFIDTADVYSKGESERITGRAITTDRNRWVVATKVANAIGSDTNRRGLSRRWLFQAIDESLERLGMDHVDIWYLHREDLETPLSETIGAVADIVRAGKVRYLGVSNHRAWRVAEIVHLCREAGLAPPAVCQPYYNAFNRMPEVELLPACAHYGIGIASYSPVARGVLAGKYRPGEAPPEDSRAARNDRRMMQTEWRDESLILAQRVAVHAAARVRKDAVFQQPARQSRGLGLVVVLLHADQHQQPLVDPRHGRALDAHAGAAHPLQQSDHASVPVECD